MRTHPLAPVVCSFSMIALALAGCGSAPEEHSAQSADPLCTQTQAHGNLHLSSLCNPGGGGGGGTGSSSGYTPPPPPSIFSSTYTTGVLTSGTDQLLATDLPIPTELAGHGCSGGIKVHMADAWFDSYMWACPAQTFDTIIPVGLSAYPDVNATRVSAGFSDNLIGPPNPQYYMFGMLASRGDRFFIAYRSGDGIGGGCRGACM